MNHKYIFYLICLGLEVLCAPTPSKEESPFYKAIVKECSSVAQIPTFKNHAIFNTCKDWNVGNKSLDATQIRCLLYYESFTQYCLKTTKIETTVPHEELNKYTLEQFCDYAKTISDKTLSVIFATDGECQKICGDDLEYLDSVCGISFYFAQKLQIEPKTDGGQDHTKDVAANSPQAVAQQGSETLSEAETTSIKSAPVPLIPNNNNPLVDSHANPPNAATNNAPALPQGIKQDHPETPVPTVDAPAVKVSHGKVEQTPAIPAQPLLSAETTKDQTNENVNKSPSDGKTNANPEHKQPEAVPQEVHPEAVPQNVQPDNNDVDIDSMDTPPEVKQEIDVDQNKNDLGPNQMLDDEELTNGDGADDDTPEVNQKVSKPLQTDESESVTYTTEMEGDSYFFTYFMILCIAFVGGYVCYHNKQKILALILEGRKGRRQYRGRRPNSANYHKLDSNLEEAITSSCKKNTNNVIY